jgi:hypothetical protein
MDAGASLKVMPVTAAEGYGASDVPATARWHEGTRGPLAGAPMFGMKCADRWCIVRSSDAAVDTLPFPHKDEKSRGRGWAVHGWHDVQTLSVMDAGGKLVRSNMRVSIIPTDDLSDMTATQFSSGFQHVATFRFYDNPVGQYKTKWAFHKGRNELYIRKTAAGTWEGEVRFKKTLLFDWVVLKKYVHPVNVKWHAHNRPFAKAARFLWREDDEAGWVACEAGCCEVSGGSFSSGY